jgi:hypothetical protein
MKHSRRCFIVLVIFTAGCERLEYHSINDVPEKEYPDGIGSVYCDSYPPGATVYIDGVNSYRKTPALIDSIPFGERMFTYRMLHFEDFEITITVDQVRTPYVRSIMRNMVNRTPYFPMSVGSYWKYVRYDHDSKTYDTTMHTVSNIVTGPDGRLTTVWKNESKKWWDDEEQFSYIRDDTLFIYITPLQQIEEYYTLILPLPFLTSTSWKFTNPYPFLSAVHCSVYSIQTLTTPAGHFEQCAVVRIARYFDYDGVALEEYWIHPNTGIVRKNDYSSFAGVPYLTHTSDLFDYLIFP